MTANAGGYTVRHKPDQQTVPLLASSAPLAFPRSRLTAAISAVQGPVAPTAEKPDASITIHIGTRKILIPPAESCFLDTDKSILEAEAKTAESNRRFVCDFVNKDQYAEVTLGKPIYLDSHEVHIPYIYRNMDVSSTAFRISEDDAIKSVDK